MAPRRFQLSLLTVLMLSSGPALADDWSAAAPMNQAAPMQAHQGRSPVQMRQAHGPYGIYNDSAFRPVNFRQSQDGPMEGDLLDVPAGESMPTPAMPEGAASSAPPSAAPSSASPGDSLPAPLMQPMPDDGSTPVIPPQYWQEGDGTFVEEPPAPTITSGTWLNNGRWYAINEFVFLSRRTSTGRDQPLATDLSVAGNSSRPSLINPQDLGFSPMARLTLGRNLGRDSANRDHSIEFTYFGLGNWQRQGTATSLAPNSLNTVGDRFSALNGPGVVSDGFSQVDTAHFDHKADLDSYELNYKITRRLGRDLMIHDRSGNWVRKAPPGILPSIFGGVRFLTTNEQFRYVTTTTSNVRSGDFGSATHNDLIGLQMGADVFFERDLFRIGARAKAGGFVNFADASRNVRSMNAAGLVTRSSFDTENMAALVAEVNMLAEYHFRPNFSARAGIDLMWINQIALANDQLSFEPVLPSRPAFGDQFFAGGSVGFSLTW